MTPCPNQDQLARLLADQLPAGEEQTISDHVDQCPACQQRLNEWAFNTDSWKEVAAALQADGANDGQVLERVVDEFQTNNNRTIDCEMPNDADGHTSPRFPVEGGVLGALGLPNRYQMADEIARGGMGAILKAHDDELGRDIAIKVLLETHQGKTEMLQRFVEEAQIGGQLQHPGIVPIYDIGCVGNLRPYFTMKLIKGRTLAALLKERRDPTHDLSRFLGIFEQVCQTLAYAHSRRVIHRDLKPANIMVGNFGEVQVMDWGLAKVLCKDRVVNKPSRARQVVEDLTAICTVRTESRSAGASSDTRTGCVLGTPAYMSPEQANGIVDSLNEGCDVFGLGAILCVILTGKPPYIGQDTSEVHFQARKGKLADAWTRIDTCGADKELIELCKRCLALRRQDRPCHAGDVANAIEAYESRLQKRLRQAEITKAQAEVQVAEERKRRQVEESKSQEERRRRRSQLALALVTMILLVGVGIAGLWYQDFCAEEARNVALVAKDIEQSLNSAENLRRKLDQQLTKKGGVFELLNQTAHWKGQIKEAQAAVQRAKSLGDRAAKHNLPRVLLEQIGKLETKLNQDEADYRLAVRLDQIREERSTWVNLHDSPKWGDFDYASAKSEYENAFAEFGVTTLDSDLAKSEQLVAHSKIREQLVAALDDWAYVLHIRHKRKDLTERILRLARLADPDPLRDQLRNPINWMKSLEYWQNLADNLLKDQQKFAELSPQMLMLVSNLLNAKKGKTQQWLRQAQHRHPDDFWLALALAGALEEDKNYVEAAGMHRTALAVRPNSAAAWNDLGITLHLQKRLPEATAAFQQALRFNKRFAGALNNWGTVLIDQNKPDEAIAILKKALKINKQLSQAWNNLGSVYYEHGKLDQAVEAFKEGLEINDQDTSALNSLGAAYVEQQKLNEAIVLFRNALKIDSKDDLTWYNLGNALQAMKKYGEAVAAYKKALKLDPNGFATWNNLGTALRRQGELDASLDAYRTALDLNNQDKIAWSNLGTVLHLKKKLVEAAEAFTKCLEIDDQRAEPWNSLGWVLYDQRKPEQAATAFRRALKIDTKFADAWYNLGNALTQLKKLEEAAQAYRKALEFNPSDEDMWRCWGNALLHRNKLNEAIHSFENALEINAKDAEAWNGLGIAFFRKNDFDKAAAAFSKAQAIDPNASTYSFNLGNARMGQRKLREAEAAYKKSLRLDKQLTRAWFYLAKCLRDQKKLNEAIDAYREGLKLNPSHLRGWTSIGIIHYAQNNPQEALVAFQKALALDLKNATAWYNLGNALSALNKSNEAVDAYKKTISIDPNYAEAHCNLGRTLRDMGKLTEALKFMRQGHELGLKNTNWNYPSAKWVREYKHLVEAEQKSNLVLQGKVQPKNATELLDLADLCLRYLKRYRDAKKLYTIAFAAKPKRTNHLSMHYRYNAARAAALAAAGKGKEAAMINDKEKAALRKTANKWLKADLQAWEKKLHNSPHTAAALQGILHHWKSDADLAGVRDEKALKNLPVAERKVWQDFWSQVDQLQKKARASYTESKQNGTLSDEQQQQTHDVKLTAGKTYVIDMTTKQFDTYLYLRDPKGKPLAENDDVSDGNLNSRIVYTPKRDGSYQLRAGSYHQRGRGSYEIIIREFAKVPVK